MTSVVQISTYSDGDFQQAFNLSQGGSPWDITGSSLKMTVRRRAADNEALIEVSSGTSGIDITDAANGKFTLTLPIERLSRMPEGQYVHSLIQTRPDGLKIPVWEGTLTHSIGPTR